MKFRVVTWNIHKCIGGVDRRYRPERVTQLLQHYEPDFALLQEVDENVRRSDYHRQVDDIGEALGLRHRCYTPTHRLRNGGHYGNAILSRWPIFDQHDLDLTIGTRKRRGAIYARARVRWRGKSRTIIVVNLHLGLAGSERDKQLLRFLESHPFAGAHHQTPIILGGDFNDLWGTLGPKHLEPAGFRRAGKIVNTFPALVPLRPLDTIYVRGNVSVERNFCSRHNLAKQASDHRPLVAEFSIH